VAVITHERVTQVVRNVIKHLGEVYTRAPGLSLAATPDGTRVHTHLQVIFGLQFSDPFEAMVYEAIVTHALNAEKMGPGGFDGCIESVLRAHSGPEAVSLVDDVKTLLTALEGTGTRATTRSSLKKVIDGSLDPKVYPLVTHALDLSGFGGRIVIEKSLSDTTSVELTRGYSFSLKPAFQCTATLDEPLVACIDGFIESVAELHLLLETTAAAKVPMLLFIRGLAPEVIHTLKVNYDRGSLKVIPLIVPFDLEGMNMLNDIATACGTDVISSNKGQLVSTLTSSDLVNVPKATVYANRTIVVNQRSARNVAAHISYLRDKRAQATDDSVQRLFDLRIKSLSPNQVVIRLPDDDRYVVKSQSIDYVLRNIKSLSEHGMWGDKPAAAYVASQINAQRCVDFLNSLGAAITP
jgi:chaperonin GroEL (HSP60 family)